MRRRSEPEYVLEACRRLTAARKRVRRQAARVRRIEQGPVDASKAAKLLAQLERSERRSEQYLNRILGWHRAHPRGRPPRKLKTRLMNPEAFRKQRIDRLTLWDEQVRKALDKQLVNAPNYKASVIALWEKYKELGLPNKHFVSELSSGKKEALLQRVWEMMLARHLDGLGYKVTTADEGPDFRIEYDGKTIWVEAICPLPKGVRQDYVEAPKPGEFKVGDVPHDEVLLRWTAAINEKRRKLDSYRQKGIVGADDAYVIAVNGCQLGSMAIDRGVSQAPYALEAVYPAGPISVPVSKTTGAFGTPYVSLRPQIKTAKGEIVRTTVFLEKENAGVSATVSFSGDRSEEAVLPVDVVHSHVANVSIPKGFFGPKAEEWGPEPDGKGGINVKKLTEEKDELGNRSVAEA
jgi:hypothetical protein